MTWVEIRKDPNAWPVLVGFKSLADRGDQWIRFGYEFPDGDWRPMGYYDARRAGYDFRRREDGLMVEVCGGEMRPAILKSEFYKEVKKERGERNGD